MQRSIAAAGLPNLQLDEDMVVMLPPVIIGLGTSLWRPVAGVKVEVGNNLGRDRSKTCPADILVPNWFLGRTAA